MAWMEAQDGGDPAVAASPRDVVYCLGADEAAAGGEPRAIAGGCARARHGAVGPGQARPGRMRVPAAATHRAPLNPRPPAHPPCGVRAGTDTRCRGVAWGTPSFALLYEAEWKTRSSKTWVIAPDAADPAAKTVRSCSWAGRPAGWRRGSGSCICRHLLSCITRASSHYPHSHRTRTPRHVTPPHLSPPHSSCLTATTKTPTPTQAAPPRAARRHARPQRRGWPGTARFA